MTGDGNSADEAGMDLAEAIEVLHSQVADARRRLHSNGGTDDSDGQEVLFRLAGITVELGMELTHTQGGDGGLRFSVVSLSGKRERAERATHKVTVQLAPHRPDGSPVDVGVESQPRNRPAEAPAGRLRAESDPRPPR